MTIIALANTFQLSTIVNSISMENNITDLIANAKALRERGAEGGSSRGVGSEGAALVATQGPGATAEEAQGAAVRADGAQEVPRRLGRAGGSG